MNKGVQSDISRFMALINLLYESLGDTVMDESIIITFANQKGGVGKTTLCVTFANYLVKKGLPVIVIDCDSQESLAQRRESDLKRYASDEITIPYEVLPFSLNKEEALFNFIGNVRKTRCVAIFDSPGNLKQQGLVTLFANSDYIICPYHYDRTTIPSTATFIAFLQKLKSAMAGKMNARLILVPNRHDARVGRKSELLLWEETRETFSRYGLVTPKINMRADMERFCTLSELDGQLEVTQCAFDTIYKEIFGYIEVDTDNG